MQLDREHLAAVRAAPEIARQREAERARRALDNEGPDASGVYLRLVRASTVKITRPVWLWDQRIPCNAVTLLAGREGKGKSALVADIGARVTRGQLDGDLHGRPGDVIYVGTEDDWHSVLVPRLTAAGADLDRVHLVAMADEMMFSIDLHLGLLEEALANLERVALIIIDPLDAHLGERIDSHRKAEVQRTLGRLAEVAQHHHGAIVGIGHLNKGDSREVLTRVIGSVGFTTSVRSVIGVGDHPDDDRDRIAVVAKSNLTSVVDVPAVRFRVEGTTVDDPDGGEPITTARIVWLGEELIDANMIVAGLDPQERTERDEAASFLRAYLADGPMPYKDVEKAAAEEGVARSTLQRAAKTIDIVRARDETVRGRPSTWALPTDEGFRFTGVSSHPQPLPGETKSKPSDFSTDTHTQPITSHEVGVWKETPSTDPQEIADLPDIALLRAQFPNLEEVTP